METIKLDLIPGKKMPSLHASQFDDGREHGIDLFENGVAYKLDGTETLTINEHKGDDCICSVDIENTFTGSNHIVFASTEQMCAVWGNNICELVIKRGSVTLGTLNFILEIEPSPTEGGIESESEISNLERQITEITEQVIGDDYYTADQTDEAIATATEGKADTTYVDTELAKKADKTNTYTKTEVDEKIDELPEPMIFKGTLGVGGTIQTLPTASASNEGWTFKCITAGTYAGLTLKVGDTVTCFNPPNTSVYEWDISGYGDTDTDTWRAIKVNGTEELGSGISSGSVDFVGSDNIEVEFDANGNKVGVKTKNIYTKTEVDSIVSDAIYNVLPDDTASGSVANFNTSLVLPLKSLEIDVNAKQDLHGQSNPYPAGGGKNILDKSSYGFVNSANIIFGGALQGYADGSLTLRAGTYTFSVSVSCTGLYVSDSEAQIAVAYNTTFVTFTIAEDKAIKLMIYKAGVTQEDILSYNYQLEVGSTATDYAPYENICPIEGWSEVSLTKCGKNLCNQADIVGAYPTKYTVDTDGSIKTVGNLGLSDVLWTNKSKVEGVLNVIFVSKYQNTGSVGIRPKIIYTDGTNSVIYTTNTQDYSTKTLLTTSSKTVDKIVVDYGTNNPTNFFIEVTLDTSATAYKPYAGTTEVINLGGTYYGGHFTQDKAGHRQFEVTHGIKLFGDISFNRSNNGGAWQSYLFYAQITDKTNGGILKCSNYEYVVQAIASMQNEKIVAVSTNKYIYIRDDAYTTVPDFKTANANTQLVYPLATPYTIDLPDGQPINTLAGVNNFYADTGDCTVVFKSSVSDYVSAHSGGNLLGMGGVYLGGAKSGGGEEETDEGENTEKTKLDEPKEEIKTIGDTKKLGGE